MPNKVTNVVIAGLGGQGVLKATDILASLLVRTGLDVKKSEIKGMSQRGGSVTGDVRFGDQVFSPMVPPGEADFLVVMEPTQVEPHRYYLKAGGLLLDPGVLANQQLPNRKSLNVAMLGALSAHLPVPESDWIEAIQTNFPQAFFEANCQAFQAGRNSQAKNS